MSSSAQPRLRFGVIGAGMSGILSAVRLQEAGHDYTVFEKADEVGGTWRENTYPGIACDVPSHIYSYSFALNPEWSYLASPGEEIQQYFTDITDRYHLRPNMRFGDAVVRCSWTGDEWEIETASGHTQRFDWVIAATGILHHPKRPDIEGLDSFGGAMFHSAQWDHDVELDGKRIGVIGNGSSGVQITGALAARAAKFSLFQRTAQWVVPVDQITYTEEQKEEFRTNADVLQQLHDELSTFFHEGFASQILDKSTSMTDDIERRCTEYLDTEVLDEDLRERLRPDYKAACKRLVVSHNFYDAIQHPNAALVTDGIVAVEPEGVRTADGTLHELDVLVLATGFHVDRFMRPMEITGIDGTRLDEVWAERPTAYMSLAIPGFPNFFMLNGPNSPVGNFSLVKTAEMQFDYIMQMVDCVEAGLRPIAMVSEEAAAAFDEERVAAAKDTVWATGCMSWYLDDRGIPFAWPFPFSRFTEEMAEPKLGDYVTA